MSSLSITRSDNLRAARSSKQQVVATRRQGPRVAPLSERRSSLGPADRDRVTGRFFRFVAFWPGYDSPQVPLRLQTAVTQKSRPPVTPGSKDPTIDKMIEKAEVTVDKERAHQAGQGGPARAAREVHADGLPRELQHLCGALGLSARLPVEPSHRCDVPARGMAG